MTTVSNGSTVLLVAAEVVVVVLLVTAVSTCLSACLSRWMCSSDTESYYITHKVVQSLAYA
jgi:hypothetical protein